MNFEQHIENLRQELEAYYATFDSAEGPLLAGPTPGSACPGFS